jgi:hypothetical protein
LKAAALGGWNISGIITRSSGPPLTITQGTSTASNKNTAILGGTRRPNLVADRSKDNIISGTTAGCTFGQVAFSANGTPSYVQNGVPGPIIPLLSGTDAATQSVNLSLRANTVSAGRQLGGPNLYFDPCAFSFADLVTVGGTQYLSWGNLGRNTLRGPGFINFDFSLSKDWKIPRVSEGFAIQFRGELYNIFNHPNLGVPTAQFINGTGAFNTQSGQINGTFNSSRQIQLGIKAVF